MRSFNKIILIGHLGRDAEIKESKNGKKYASLSIATSEKFKVNDEWQERTTWHQVYIYGEYMVKRVTDARKGDPVAVEGKYESSKGKEDKLFYAVNCSWVDVLKPKEEASGGDSSGGSSSEDDDLPF